MSEEKVSLNKSIGAGFPPTVVGRAMRECLPEKVQLAREAQAILAVICERVYVDVVRLGALNAQTLELKSLKVSQILFAIDAHLSQIGEDAEFAATAGLFAAVRLFRENLAKIAPVDEDESDDEDGEDAEDEDEEAETEAEAEASAAALAANAGEGSSGANGDAGEGSGAEGKKRAPRNPFRSSAEKILKAEGITGPEGIVSRKSMEIVGPFVCALLREAVFRPLGAYIAGADPAKPVKKTMKWANVANWLAMMQSYFPPGAEAGAAFAARIADADARFKAFVEAEAARKAAKEAGDPEKAAKAAEAAALRKEKAKERKLASLQQQLTGLKSEDEAAARALLVNAGFAAKGKAGKKAAGAAASSS